MQRLEQLCMEIVAGNFVKQTRLIRSTGHKPSKCWLMVRDLAAGPAANRVGAHLAAGPENPQTELRVRSG
jgi:hypothetical protein